MSSILLSHVTKIFPPEWKVVRLVRSLLSEPPGRSNVIKALIDVDLEIEEGIILGLLGPIGSGKSTLLRLIAGTLRPTSGKIWVHGLDPFEDKEQLRGRIGYLMRQPSSFTSPMSGLENLRTFAGLQGMSPAQGKKRAHELIHAVGLKTVAQMPVSQYTSGMTQRLSMARVLLSKPDLILMDEATTGLDADQRSNFYGFLLDHVRVTGCTVLYTTHDLNEAQFLCHKVALLDKGQLLAQGSYLDVQQTAMEIFSRQSTNERTEPSLYPGQVEDKNVDRITQFGRR